MPAVAGLLAVIPRKHDCASMLGLRLNAAASIAEGIREDISNTLTYITGIKPYGISIMSLFIDLFIFAFHHRISFHHYA